MTDPNRPIIDTRTTVVGAQPPAAAPAGSGGSTPPAQPAPAPITPAGSSSTTVKTTSTVPIATTIPEQYTASSYAELIPQLEKRMAEYKPLSEEELKKLRRRQKAEGIISGISDAVQSVANLFYTTQYAPNMYNAKEGMSAKARERFDKAKAEREAEDDRFFNYALMLGRLRDADAKDQREWNHTIEREKIADQYKEAADARAQAKADRDAAMAELRMKLMEGKINQQDAAAEAEKIEADYAEAYWQSRINKNNYRRPIGSGSRGGGGSHGGGGRPAEYPYYDAQGNLHYTHSYESMRQNAIKEGTWNEGTSTSIRTTKDRRGNTKGTSVTTKQSKGHSSKPKKKNRLGL